MSNIDVAQNLVNKFDLSTPLSEEEQEECDNAEMMLTAISFSQNAIKYVSYRLKDNEAFMLKAIEISSTYAYYLSPRLKDNEDFIKKAMAIKHDAVYAANPFIQTKLLLPPLPAEDVQIRVQQCTAKVAIFLIYKTARTDRKYLNLLYGPTNWTSAYHKIDQTLFCTISVYNQDLKQWISKSDCCGENKTEEEKSDASDALKRAGFQWGIGEELYTAKNLMLLNATEQKEQGQQYKLKKEFENLDIIDIQYDNNRCITKIVCENRYNIVTFYPKQKIFGDVVAKTSSTTKPLKSNIQTTPIKQPIKTTINQTTPTTQNTTTFPSILDVTNCLNEVKANISEEMYQHELSAEQIKEFGDSINWICSYIDQQGLKKVYSIKDQQRLKKQIASWLELGLYKERK